MALVATLLIDILVSLLKKVTFNFLYLGNNKIIISYIKDLYFTKLF